MRRNRVFAYALQETWRSGTQETCIHGFAIIQHGLPCPIKRKQGRLSGGVAIVLSPEAHRAWKKAGSLRWEFGERIVAVRLGVRDEKGKDVSIFFVSAYAPVSNVKQSVRDKYHQELERCVAAAGKEDILLIATDANASMGVRTGERDSVLGPFGIQHRNQSGV